MPVYSYKCISCGYTFEESHKIDDRSIPTKTPCPKCGKEIQIDICAVGFVDPIRIGVRKRPDWFVDRLKQIKKKHPLGNMNI